MEGPADLIPSNVDSSAVAHRCVRVAMLTLLLGVAPISMPAGPVPGEEGDKELGAPARQSAAAPTAASRELAEAARRNLALALTHAKAIERRTGRATARGDVAKALAKRGDVAGAKRVLAQARAEAAKRLEPQEKSVIWLHGSPAQTKTDALVIVATAQAKVGDTAGSKRSLAQAEAKAAAWKDATEKARALVGIARTLTTVGDVAGAKRRLLRARALAASEPESARDSFLLSRIVEEMARVGDLAGAEATAAAIIPAFFKAAALSGIAEALVKSREVAAAKLVLDRARAAAARIDLGGLKDEAMRRLAGARATAGDLTGALEDAAAIEDPYFKAFCLMEIATAQAKAGDGAGAKRLLGEAKALAAKFTDGLGRGNALGWIAICQARAGDLASADVTADDLLMIPLGPKDLTADRKAMLLGLLAVDYLKAGGAAGARRFLVEAKAAVPLIESSPPDSETFYSIARALAWTEGVPPAEKWASSLALPAQRCHAHLGVAEAAAAMAQGRAKPTENEDED